MESDPIDALRSTPTPPAHLQARTLSAVRAAGALRSPWPFTTMWLTVAATVIFLAGLGVGRMWRPGPPTDVSAGRSQYLLLLAGTVTPAPDGGTRSAEYGAWAQSVSTSGRDVRGAELSPTVRLVGQAGDALAEGLASVGGYFIIEAESEADAVRVAETCPHVKYGGVIQIRRLLP